MVKRTTTILSDHFVGLALKGLTIYFYVCQGFEYATAPGKSFFLEKITIFFSMSLHNTCKKYRTCCVKSGIKTL